MKTCFIFAFWLGCAGWAFSQCVSEKAETLLISDRYTDAAQIGDQLILANAHGLVFKDLDGLTAANRQVLAIPGETVGVAATGAELFVTVKNNGVRVYAYQGPDLPPRQIDYHPIPGVLSAVRTETAIFALTADGVALYQIEEFGEPAQVGFHPVKAVKIAATDRLVFMLGETGTLTARAYSDEGWDGPGQNLNVAGSTVFYDMSKHGDTMVLDALGGVHWMTFDNRGEIEAEGTYYDSRFESDVIFASMQFGSRLFLRFGDRMDIYSISPSRSLSLTDSLPMPFSELGVVKIIPAENSLHLLNMAVEDRAWSLTSYQIGAGKLILRDRLPANFNTLTAAALASERLFVASGKDLQFVPDLDSLKLIRTLPVVWQFVGSVLEMAGSDRRLFVASDLPDTGFTRFHIFSIDENGALNEIFTRDFQGALRHFSQEGDRVALSLYYRTTTADHYQARVFYEDGQGVFQTRALDQSLPFQSQTPYRDLQMTASGMVYHDGASITVHPDPSNLAQSYAAAPPNGDAIANLVGSRDRFWIETEGGVWLVKPNGEAGLENLGLYGAWQELSRLSNNLVTARNKHDRAPSRYTLLGLTAERDLVHGQVAFNTASEPFFIAALDDVVFVAEETSISTYRQQCPTMDYEYLTPIADNLEMELSSALEDSDAVSMIILNAANQVIGLQQMTPELVDAFNGSSVSDWIFDFNMLEEPKSYIMLSSAPLAPIVSGEASEKASARFAYLLPEGAANTLYVPHVPRDNNVWRTEIYLRSFDASTVDAPFELSDASGSEMVSGRTETGTEVISIDQSLFGSPTPWAVVFSDDLNAAFSGFSVFESLPQNQAAAVPLVTEHSDYMILPRLAGADDDGGWTGMVLANPTDQPVVVRLIGYDAEGGIAVDQTASIEAAGSFIALAELWLGQFVDAQRVRWMAVIAERPIMGIVLYGNLATSQMAGLPMQASSGHTLLFSGIRANLDWWTNLALTNSELTAAEVTIEALDGSGALVATASSTLNAKGSATLSVDEMFRAFSGPDRARIRTIRVRSETWICGFATRGQRNEPSLEAFSAFAQ